MRELYEEACTLVTRATIKGSISLNEQRKQFKIAKKAYKNGDEGTLRLIIIGFCD